MGVFQAGNGVDEIALRGVGQGGGNAIEVEFLCTAAFRLQEDLVAGFFRKAHDFVFNGRTVPGAYTLNDAAIERAEF